MPDDLTAEQRKVIEQLIHSHIATAYVWEYRYLNYYFVSATQHVLDWLISLPHSFTYAHFDSTWIPFIPSANEKLAIITALQTHHLIQLDDSGLIVVTPKGREYAQWRGQLPPPTNTST